MTTGKIPCTVGILTRNSGRTLARCIESVKDFDEIIVCDGGSTDDTLAVAARHGARIIRQDPAFLDAEGYIQNFSGVRNQSVEAAAYEWYFWLDSDEYASPELVAEVAHIVKERSEGAFNVFRRYVLQDGREVECCSSYPNRSMRLFSKRSVSGFRKIVHERPVVREGVVPEDLSGKLFVPVDPDRASVARRNDRYIALEVKRKGYVGLFRFLGYARFELRASLAYALRLVHSYLFCRGVHFPLSIELARFRYAPRLLAAMWRTRRLEYPPVVLFFTNKWKTGGAEHVLLQEYEAFRKEGIAVRWGSAYGSELPPGVEERYAIFPRFRNLLDIPGYVRLLRRIGDEGVTHVIAVLEHAAIVARVAAVFAPRVRLVVVEAGMAGRKPWRYKLLDLLLNWRVSCVVAGSSGVRESLVRYQRMYARKIAILLNGVDVPAQRAARDEPERFTVLAVGSLRAEKDFSMLLDAFALFRRAIRVDAELVILGKGVLEGALKAHAQDLGISESVRLVGEVPHEEALAWFTRVHCFTLSSKSEGNPTVVMEALAQGTPVIATRVSGVVDYIEDGVSGLLVPIGAAAACADALGRMYADPALRERLGREGYELAKRRLSFDEHVRGLKRILKL